MKFSEMRKDVRHFFNPEECLGAYVCVELENKYGSDAEPLLDLIHTSKEVLQCINLGQWVIVK